MYFYSEMMIAPIVPEINVNVKIENEENLLLIQLYSAMKEQSKKPRFQKQYEISISIFPSTNSPSEFVNAWIL